jgi:ubiquinone/menaquinone biosynthesis C-methylase UbiE
MTDFWKEYWQNADILRETHPQNQVGRTINKQPIAEDRWHDTLDFIATHLKPSKNDVLLDLCAGNGLLSVFFAKTMRQVMAVDISEDLLNKIDTTVHQNIRTVQSDLLALDLANESFDKALMYFALQHFSLKETINVFQKVHDILKPGGLFYIGDIPDAALIWNFFNNKDREKAYFESVLTEEPIVGQWFDKAFIQKGGKFAGFSDVQIISQPAYQFNSHYRFDALLKK